jgi:hypothetical protein
MPMGFFQDQLSSCVKETDAIMKLLHALMSILDGHHKQGKTGLDLQKKISFIYDMESRAHACGDIERAKLLKTNKKRLKKSFLLSSCLI